MTFQPFRNIVHYFDTKVLELIDNKHILWNFVDNLLDHVTFYK